MPYFSFRSADLSSDTDADVRATIPSASTNPVANSSASLYSNNEVCFVESQNSFRIL